MNERREGSLRWREMPVMWSTVTLWCGDSSPIMCTELIDDLRELTLLDLRDEMDARFPARPFDWPPHPEPLFTVPKPAPRFLTMTGDEGEIAFMPLGGECILNEAFLFPFLSSLNHVLKVDKILVRLRPLALDFPGADVVEVVVVVDSPFPVDSSAGVLVGVGAAEVEERAITHGLDCVKLDDAVISFSRSGVNGGGGTFALSLSFTGFNGGDFWSFDGPDAFLLFSFSFSSFSFSSLALFSRSLSSLSFTASAERFRTKPAASNAVVALCMMLTLPERGFPNTLPSLPSLLFVLPPGVVGVDFPVAVPVRESAREGVGDNSERGDFDRGGVMGR